VRGSREGSSSPHADVRGSFEREFPGGSESANATFVALVQVAEAFVAMLNRVLRRHGLSAAGAQALGIIEGAGEPTSPTLIAERLIVSTAAVTSLLDTLERRGLIVRTPDQGDRRRVLVSLTDDARDLVERFLPEVVAVQTAIMVDIPEAERTRLLRSLGRVGAALEGLDAEAVVATARPRGKPAPGLRRA
jgi:DNA-binding MarR family transcriptional regulator